MEIDTLEIENELSQYIISVIKSIEEATIYELLRQYDYIEIDIPKLEIGSYVVNEFTAKIPRDKVEEILFNV